MATITKLFGRLTDVDSVAKYDLGTVYRGLLGKSYVYGRYDTGTGALTCHKYIICVPYPVSNVIASGVFTPDFDDCPEAARAGAVVSQGRHVTDGYFGWFGCQGRLAVEQATTLASQWTDGQRVYVSANKTCAVAALSTGSTATTRLYLYTFGTAAENSATTPTSATSDIFFDGRGYE